MPGITRLDPSRVRTNFVLFGVDSAAWPDHAEGRAWVIRRRAEFLDALAARGVKIDRVPEGPDWAVRTTASRRPTSRPRSTRPAKPSPTSDWLPRRRPDPALVGWAGHCYQFLLRGGIVRMKVSVSLRGDDVDVPRQYAKQRGLMSTIGGAPSSRAAPSGRRAGGHIRNSAWAEWADGDDAEAWEATSGDGLSRDQAG